MTCTVRWVQNLVVEHREVKSQAKSVSLREKDERERERDVKESRNNYDHAKVEKEKVGQSKR